MQRLPSLEVDMASHLDRLAGELGLKIKLKRPHDQAADLVLELAGGGFHPFVLVVELCANPRLASALLAAERAAQRAGKMGWIPVVGLPHLGQRVAEALRAKGVGFISLDGGMSIRGPNVLIEREVASRSSRWVQNASLFSDKSSLILRYLFDHPSVQVHVRDLSGDLAVSPGLVSRVLDRLRRDGFLVAKGESEELVERDLLLDEWRELYKRRAKRQREKRCYLHVRQIDDVFGRLATYPDRPSGPRWALSFQAGASLVRPFAFFSEVHLLVNPRRWEQNVDELMNSLELEPAEHEANVVLVEPYYRHSWDFGVRNIRGVPVVSDLQLYLDLSVYPRRGAEQSEFLRERLVNPDQSYVPK